MEIQRTVTVPIIVKDRDELKALAATAARFANAAIDKRYLEAQQGYNERLRLEERTEKNGKITIRVTMAALHPYKDYNEALSSNVRDAMTTEVESVWGRYAKACLAGHRSLPTFESDRALCVRNTGVKISRVEDGGFSLKLKLLPGNSWHEYPVFALRLKKDIWLAGLLRRIETGEFTCTGAKIVFDRLNKRKIMARIGYKTDIDPKVAGEFTARIGPLGDDGELALRVDGPAYSFEDRRRLAHMTAIVQRMQTMKRDCEGIWRRVRMSKKRNAMKKLQRFEEWADGPVHELSRKIVDFLRDKHVGQLEWLLEGGDLPWSKIRFQVEYKGAAYGLEVVDGKQKPMIETKGDLLCAIQTKKALREAKKAARMGIQA